MDLEIIIPNFNFEKACIKNNIRNLNIEPEYPNSSDVSLFVEVPSMIILKNSYEDKVYWYPSVKALEKYFPDLEEIECYNIIYRGKVVSFEELKNFPEWESIDYSKNY